ncbi:Aflatoxin biosynthesis regulatory protein [Penicillium cinerascens]|uniref:Aflatoxin biosynthesis regulatory protein n=1 Tax=Penicillium cinerascens TaxID=70096 RepID=A0A9W9T0D0_9EURO|nr:Aflatoxin biosynthesis regulatory protein [Penicillium cinerascens]KAJ5204783.1 Aflatoxin biosynthesis regulatory protein [Penicillium cinerascens]
MKCRDPDLRRKILAIAEPSAYDDKGIFKCAPVALLVETLMNVEENCTPALKEAANSKSPNSPAGKMRLVCLLVPEHEAPATYSYLGHEEALRCEYGVVKPRNGLTTDINGKDVTR